MPDKPPITASWWVQPDAVLAGPFPGVHRQPQLDAGVLRRLLDAGVRTIINLQELHEQRHRRPFPSYAELWQQEAAARGVAVWTERFPVRDVSVPTTDLMRQILAALRAAVRRGGVYVHCMGGHGRSATVAGCWLVEQGAAGHDALAMITTARAHDAYLRTRTAPESHEQREFVRRWQPMEQS